jgi:hypothetical protein
VQDAGSDENWALVSIYPEIEMPLPKITYMISNLNEVAPGTNKVTPLLLFEFQGIILPLSIHRAEAIF